MIPRIGAVILAAGTASRMGRQKLLLPLGDKPVVAHVLAVVSQIPFAARLMVIGEPQQELAALGSQYGIRSVYNPDRYSGQATSIAKAICYLEGEVDGVLFLPGDQPLITAELLQALLSCFGEEVNNRRIVVPSHKGQYRSPVLFGAAWLPELAALSGDRGGRELIRNHPEAIAAVEWLEEATFRDADTWDDYLELVQYLHKN